jgi:hypothetical protein
MLQADHLDWRSDKDCVSVAKFVIEWLFDDGNAIDPESLAKDVSVYEFLCDMLISVTDNRYESQAQTLLAKIGQ